VTGGQIFWNLGADGGRNYLIRVAHRHLGLWLGYERSRQQSPHLFEVHIVQKNNAWRF